MPVIEYKFQISETGRNVIPGYVEDRGHWYNPADHTYVGWVKAEADREYWVPDTIEELTKAEMVTRVLGMHATNPMMAMDSEGVVTETPMTNDEVTTMVEAWYDAFVTANS
jgi:FMN-dependent NADH-azoreductase